MSITEQRIGTGIPYFILGGLFFVIGLFPALAAIGGANDALLFATFLFMFGTILIAIGFWVRLFGLLEARLIDIQRAVTNTPERLEAKQTADDVCL